MRIKNHALVAIALIATLPTLILGQNPAAKPATPSSTRTAKPEYPPLDKVVEGYKEVPVSDGSKPFLRLWVRAKDGQMYAELPKSAVMPNSPVRHFIALTVSGGEWFAGRSARGTRNR